MRYPTTIITSYAIDSYRKQLPALMMSLYYDYNTRCNVINIDELSINCSVLNSPSPRSHVTISGGKKKMR